MVPSEFPESNGTLLGFEIDGGTVEDLRVFRNGEVIISSWRPSLLERLRILFGARVWLHVMAEKTHAPVALEVSDPFRKEPSNA